MKELIKGDLNGVIGYEAKIEDGEIKISASVKLEGLIDLAAAQVDGGAVEMVVVQLAKQVVKGL